MNNSRRRYSNATGRVAEVRFIRSARKKGLLVNKSSHTEDIHDHVDYWLAMSSNGNRWGVDVKGNNLPDEIWVEFRNVHGQFGWMMGDAKWIAFEMCELGGFVRVEREELLDWCLCNVDFTTSVIYKCDAYRKIYQRRNRKDKISMLVLSDLQELKSYEVIKYKASYVHPLTNNTITI